MNPQEVLVWTVVHGWCEGDVEAARRELRADEDGRPTVEQAERS